MGVPIDLDPEPPRRSRGRLIVGGLWLALFVTVASVAASSDISVDEAADTVRHTGGWGSLGFYLVFGLLQPLGLSSNLLCVAAGLIWEWWFAMPLALAGAVTSATVSYLLARYVAYDWVQARLPQRLRRYESWLLDKGMPGIIGFRMITFTLHPAMWMMGTTRVGFRPMLVGTIIGFVPAVALGVLLGGEVLPAVLDAWG